MIHLLPTHWASRTSKTLPSPNLWWIGKKKPNKPDKVKNVVNGIIFHARLLSNPMFTPATDKSLVSLVGVHCPTFFFFFF